MLALAKIQEYYLSNEVSDNLALNLHIAVEAYLRRLIFIGLRKNGVQYDIANRCTSKIYYGKHSQELKVICQLLEIDIDELKRFKSFGKIDDFFLNYTSKYRNKRVHGSLGASSDEDYLLSIIKIDKAYIRVFEDFFKSKKLHSAFNKPRLWCNKVQGTISKEEDVYTSLLGIGPQTEFTFDDAMKLINEEEL